EMGIRPGHEWEPFEGLDVEPEAMRRFLAEVPFVQRGRRRYEAPAIPVPEHLAAPKQASLSTQGGFGLILHEIAKTDSAFAARIVTTSRAT
ncbi:transketolase, partial [Halomonas sp. ND22Bw]|uniref:hypothetical protein n=1 Tax=Halomonas sp. ND22Bw TaxID=2054178 RepID=UPI000D2B5868